MSAPTYREILSWATGNLSGAPLDDFGGYSPRELIVPLIELALDERLKFVLPEGDPEFSACLTIENVLRHVGNPIVERRIMQIVDDRRRER